jgi:hypothetical protein
MIKASDKDTNRSGDIKGPELKRGDEKMPKVSGSGYDTQVLSKHSLDDLHQGDVHTPLTALGQQKVREGHPMGRAGASTAGGKGMRQSMPKGMGRSIAKKMEYAEKEKDR